MPKFDDTTSNNQSGFSPKKHTPWDALEKFANELAPKTSLRIKDEKNGIQNGIQNDRQNGIQNGIQNESLKDKRYTEKAITIDKTVYI